MPSAELNITVVQPNIVWEDKDANMRMYEQLIAGVQEKKEVVVLPEMFSTGFSMAPERLAENMDGATLKWMKDICRKYRCILTGSVIIEEDGQYYNRLLWVQPDGQLGYYDKRHLFAYADENEYYSRGARKLITQVKGFRICPLVCYDLRFPVWARNQGDEYDVLLYVANWPERRNLAWKTLLQARAIENQCYVIGVNRVGKDGKDINYSGDSSVFDPMGEMLWRSSNEVATHTVTLSKDKINEVRSQLPFLKDADRFLILD
jgi:predicted amidohydrolase